jgi:hypothetical protein
MAFAFIILTTIYGFGRRHLGAGAKKPCSGVIPSKAAKPQAHHPLARLRYDPALESRRVLRQSATL